MGGTLYPLDPEIEELYNFLRKYKIEDFFLSDRLQIILGEFRERKNWEWYRNVLSEKLYDPPKVRDIFLMFLNQLYHPDYHSEFGIGFDDEPPIYREKKNRKKLSKFLKVLDSIVIELIKTMEINDFDVEGLIDKLRMCGIRQHEIERLKFVKYREMDGLKIFLANLYSLKHPLFFGTKSKSWRMKERKLFFILEKKFKDEYRSIRGAYERYLEGGIDANRMTIDVCRNVYENFFKKITRHHEWKKNLKDFIESETFITLIKKIYNFLSGLGPHSPKERKTEDAFLALHLTAVIILRVLIEIQLIE